MQSSSQHLRARLKRALGWLTADRQVEAEGEAELRTGGEASDQTVQQVKHEVKQRYGETLD